MTVPIAMSKLDSTLTGVVAPVSDDIGDQSFGLALASSPGRQLKFRKKDGLVAIATMLVRMRWPLPEKHVIVYLACKPFRKLTHIRPASLRFCL